jgi:hypothetical protein
MEAVIGTIGVVTMGSIVGSITTVSSSIYTLVSNIRVNKHIHNSDIVKILTKTDVVATIKLLQAVMMEIPENYINCLSVITSLKNVYDIIEQIENELKDLNNKVDYNRNLYIMSNWRSYDFKDNLEKIEQLICILDRRKDNLFKVLEAFKNIEIKNTDENKLKVKNFLNSNNFSKYNSEFEVIDKEFILTEKLKNN